MTESEVFSLSVRIATQLQETPPGELRRLLMDCLHLLQKQDRDILALEVSLHDLAMDIDFGN